MTDAVEAVASLDVCVVCGSESIHETTPLVPSVAAVECDNCGYTWRGRGDL